MPRKETVPHASGAGGALRKSTALDPNADPGAGTTTASERFLKVVFGDAMPNAYVTAFPEDPAGDHDARTRGRMWRGGTYAALRSRLKPDTNQYVVVSTFRASANPKDCGQPRRKAALFERAYAIMVDDIGTKVNESAIKLPLTALVETSPGNFQGWYALEPADPDAANARLVEHVVDEMIRRGLAKVDPGMKGVTRYGRLPAGVNNKAKLKQPFDVKLTDLKPSLRYKLHEVGAAYGIDLVAAKHRFPARDQNSGVVTEFDGDYGEFNEQLIAALEAAGCNPHEAANKPDAFDVICPWAGEHTGGDESGSMIFLAGYVDPSTGEIFCKGGYKCHHGHCEDRGIRTVVAWLNTNHGADLQFPGETAKDMFPPLPRVAALDTASDKGTSAPIEPVDFFRPPLPNPLDLEMALPPVLRDFALAHAEARGQDATAYAYATLPVMAAALHRDTQVALRADWCEGVLLWVGLVGITGAGKSPVMNTAIDILTPLQIKARQEYRAAVDFAKASDKRLAPEDRPRLFLYVINDTTPEALQEAIIENPHGLVQHKDEGAGWLNGMGQYSGNQGGRAAERAMYLSAWIGKSYTVTRITRGVRYVERWGLNQLFGITPSQITHGYAEAATDGMLARMLMFEIVPERSLARSGGANPLATEDAARRRVGLLAGLPAITLALSPEASRLFEERAAVYRELTLALGATEPGLAAVYAKAAPHLGRVAALFHLLDPPMGHIDNVVGEEAMRRARVFMAHALAEAERLHKHVFGRDTPYGKAKRCAVKILTHGQERITRNQLMKVNEFDKAAESEREAAIRLLRDGGWLVAVDSKQNRGGPMFHQATAWTVNPRVFDLFAEVAAREREEAARLVALFARAKTV